MRPVQRTEASQGLERHFGLKGHIGISLDEVVVPTADVGDFAGSSPYEERALGMDAQLSPAMGATRYSGYLVTPGPNTVLVIEQATVANNSGLRLITFKLMLPADVAAVNVSATSAIAQINGLTRSTGFLPQLAATASIWDHNTTVIGAEIHRFELTGAPATNVHYRFPRGLVLRGDDPAGGPSFAILMEALNVPLPVGGVYVTEYRA